MPMQMKVRFQCDDGSVCTSGGIQPARSEEVTVAITSDVMGFFSALKMLPNGWTRDDRDALKCAMCTGGRIRL